MAYGALPACGKYEQWRRLAQPLSSAGEQHSSTAHLRGHAGGPTTFAPCTVCQVQVLTSRL